jgi:hypothetical protein
MSEFSNPFEQHERRKLAETERFLRGNPQARAALLYTAEELPESGNPSVSEGGAALVGDIETFLTRYVVLPSHAALPLALWAMMTYEFDAFDTVPYLVIGSPTPRCGKTRLLECLELIVAEPRRASNISEAALFRTIEKIAPTLLLDEAEILSGKSERAEYLRQILNAGNRRAAKVTRCDGANHDVRDFSVFCPKVLAGIGSFPPTITDRAIAVPMQRRKDSEKVAQFRYRKVEPIGKALGARAGAFLAERREEIAAAYGVAELGFISDRDADAWEPLFAILSVAAPERVAELQVAAQRLTSSKSANAEDDSLSLRLLTDMRDVWPQSEPKMFTVTLVEQLKKIEDGPWKDDERFNARRLSRLLRPFGVTPATVQIGPENRKGYYRADIEAQLDRYIASEPSGPSEPA